jgi:hypothetical protein
MPPPRSYQILEHRFGNQGDVSVPEATCFESKAIEAVINTPASIKKIAAPTNRMKPLKDNEDRLLLYFRLSRANLYTQSK